MTSGRYKNDPDSEGYFFIDRDGDLFKYILNFLRNKKLVGISEEEKDGLMQEAMYFQIQELIDELAAPKEVIPSSSSVPKILLLDASIIDKSKWTFGRGQWSISENILIQSQQVPSYPLEAIIGDPQWSDYIISADILSEPNLTGHPGIIFHAQDTRNYDGPSYCSAFLTQFNHGAVGFWQHDQKGKFKNLKVIKL